MQGFSSDLGGEQDEKARFGVKIGESESTSVSVAWVEVDNELQASGVSRSGDLYCIWKFMQKNLAALKLIIKTCKCCLTTQNKFCRQYQS